jgi:hypothetical protein
MVGDGLKAGSVLEGTVTPPLPYRMRVQVTIDRCRPRERIDATVRGDLTGHAVLTLAPVDAGSEVAVTWTIEMRQRAMRAVARVAHPLLRWGHDRVVESTVAGFRQHLAATPEPTDPEALRGRGGRAPAQPPGPRLPRT